MDKKTFENEYLCTFSIDKDEEYLRLLAYEYHKRTEEYDRKICTGPIIDGSIIPSDNYEFIQVNKHALSVKREIENRAMNERGIDKKIVSKTINNYRY